MILKKLIIRGVVMGDPLFIGVKTMANIVLGDKSDNINAMELNNRGDIIIEYADIKECIFFELKTTLVKVTFDVAAWLDEIKDKI
jgi:hypothetical protein